ncbi:MAG: signal peptidase II [Planctomycetaceae bacterium]
MKRLPGHRYVLFALLALCGLGVDLASKSVVFTDLGYPAGSVAAVEPGAHELFDRPDHLPPASDGQTPPYLDGWVTFRLYTSFNRGALWGIGQGQTWLFAALSVVALVGIPYFLFVRGAAQSRWLTVSLGFIMAGTLGNLYDRLGLHGLTDSEGETIHAVRDFLLFTFGGWSWPVFNFADMFLVTGAGMLFVQSFRTEPKREPDAADQTRSEPSTRSATTTTRR